MDSSFYNGGQETMGEAEPDRPSSGLLDVYIHHARNIHNICIYANQDVYAKFSLTCTPDDVLSTNIVPGGGKNPQFDEKLTVKVPHPDDAVLKCEIWMLSRARNFLEDQLLGFALVPLSSVAAEAKRKLTRDFTLSSTDLFHSPAGTVQLTLSLRATSSDGHSFASESITSEVVILDPVEMGAVEFPDVDIAKENQLMVAQYFDMAPGHPFMQFGTLSQSTEDYEMAANSSGSDSPNGSIVNSGAFTASTTASLTDDRNSADSAEKKNSGQEIPDTPTSKEKVDSCKESELESVFKSPLGNINLEAEQSAMQKQIIDMYMRSVQQFTESLAKMKLPMDLDIPRTGDGGDVIQTRKPSEKLDDQKKKDGARVFYGSRAFF